MREAPPGHRGDRRILNPGKEQQQAKNGLDVDRHHEQGVDVEIHQVGHQRQRGPGRRAGIGAFFQP